MAGLHRILTDPITPLEARRRIAAAVANRERTFLATLEHGVYANVKSPFRRLLLHFGFDLPEVRRLVHEIGIEATLSRLYEAGVYVTAAEFKGRQPIQRSGLDFVVHASDFDNPLVDGNFAGQTSGSSGAATRVFVGFDLMAQDAAYYASLFDAAGINGRPLAYWHGALHTALKTLFKHLKRGRKPERWFTPFPFSWSWRLLKEQYLLLLTFFVSLLHGQRLPSRIYVPRGEAWRVARWLAVKKREGQPAVLETNHSQAVRACLAARDEGRDISGTVFHLTGEPYTEARAAVIEGAGASALDRYANVELGVMGIACSQPQSFDDQHFVSDKLALLVKEKQLSSGADPVQALVLTTISPVTPKLMLNVESGDYATVSERDCGCPFAEAGLMTHLANIRAYDKLTSDGVTFQAGDLFDLIEAVLPARFGGNPTDYQLVETDSDGLPQVTLLIRPTVGELDESEVVSTVYRALRSRSAGMAREWLEGSVLKVARADPMETGSAKILPLHIVRDPNEQSQPVAG